MDWWANSAIYQVYPRSFQDTNGDGEGDLVGVISRLSYLKSLGIDAIWLSPFYLSPNNDGGYDVEDPRAVDPRFGSMEDAVNLIKAAHKSDLRIIVDLVPNHFSTEHQWFKAALQSLPGSLERSRFHFYDGRGESGEIPPNNWCSIFGGPAWSRVKEVDGKPGQWYLHLFDSTQADLNWESDEVKKDFEKTLRFWLDKGVDGFRIDVAHGLVKEDIFKDHRDPEGLTRALRLDVSDMDRVERESLLADVPFFDKEGVHEIYRSWRKILDSYEGQKMSVAEAWVHPSSRAMRYVRSDELHQIFNFDFLIAPWDSEFLVSAINKTLSEVGQVGASPTWVLSNHDSPRLVTRLGGGQLGRQRAKAMALLTHGLPGGIYIYQGEELGLEDGDLEDKDRQDPVFFRTKGVDKGRDGARIPIPWSSQLPNYGFTTTKPWLPIPSTWQDQCVEAQVDSESHLTLYRKSLHMRKLLSRQIAQSNAITWIDTPNGVLAFSRGNDFFLYANTTGQSLELKLESNSQIILSSSAKAQLKSDTLTLPADSTVWLGKITK